MRGTATMPGQPRALVVVGQIGIVEQVRRTRVRQSAARADMSRPGCRRAARSRRGCGGPRECGPRFGRGWRAGTGRSSAPDGPPPRTARRRSGRWRGGSGRPGPPTRRSRSRSPSRRGAREMDDAGALLPRRPAREVGAAQRPPVGRQARMREQLRQPVGCRRARAAPSPQRGRSGRAAARPR